MKQKYAIIRDDDQKALIVREYAELDKEMMSLLCEESYSQADIIAAMKQGTQAVINAIRTNNMYPPTMFAQAIAEAIIAILAEGGNPSAELFFDDKELFNQDIVLPAEEDIEEEVDEEVDVDDLLDDTLEDDFEDDKVLKDLKSSIQVADDENSDQEDM